MFSRKKPRGLSDDDLKLWQEVVKSAKPMRRDAPLLSASVGLPVIAKPVADFSPVLERRGKSSVSLDLAPTSTDRLAPDPLRMDMRRYAQMRRGKLAPEARLDLHGLTLDQAHRELIPFVLSAWSNGLRLVLVITGKGRPNIENHTAGHSGPRSGVLRHHVPHWLASPPLRQIVLQTSEANQKHGGAGAIYIYLRRQDRGPF